MRVETNDQLVKRNKKIATYLFIFSLAVLIFGFISANSNFFGMAADDPEDAGVYVTLMPIVLIVGMVSTLTSVRMTNLWVRQPRPEAVIQEGLKGISNKSVLYNYLHLPARHVLIAPQGVFAIITRFQDGHHSVTGTRWRTHRNPIAAFFSIFKLDAIGNPTLEAQRAAAVIQAEIDGINPDVKVQPLIVFVDSRAKVDVTDTPVPVVYADPKLKPNLKEYVKDIPKDRWLSLSPEQIEAFEEATIEFVYE